MTRWIQLQKNKVTNIFEQKDSTLLAGGLFYLRMFINIIQVNRGIEALTWLSPQSGSCD
jgi:hypothetical protein